MGNEWVCKDCGQTMTEDPGSHSCPACGGEMINIGEVDEDLKEKSLKDNKDESEMDDKELEILDDDKFDPDFGEEPEAVDSKKN